MARYAGYSLLAPASFSTLFSLSVLAFQSLDLEATSKMEREAMAQGFSMLMATIEAAANV